MARLDSQAAPIALSNPHRSNGTPSSSSPEHSTNTSETNHVRLNTIQRNRAATLEREEEAVDVVGHDTATFFVEFDPIVDLLFATSASGFLRYTAEHLLQSKNSINFGPFINTAIPLMVLATAKAAHLIFREIKPLNDQPYPLPERDKWKLLIKELTYSVLIGGLWAVTFSLAIKSAFNPSEESPSELFNTFFYIFSSGPLGLRVGLFGSLALITAQEPDIKTFNSATAKWKVNEGMDWIASHIVDLFIPIIEYLKSMKRRCLSGTEHQPLIAERQDTETTYTGKTYSPEQIAQAISGETKQLEKKIMATYLMAFSLYFTVDTAITALLRSNIIKAPLWPQFLFRAFYLPVLYNSMLALADNVLNFNKNDTDTSNPDTKKTYINTSSFFDRHLKILAHAIFFVGGYATQYAIMEGNTNVPKNNYNYLLPMALFVIAATHLSLYHANKGSLHPVETSTSSAANRNAEAESSLAFDVERGPSTPQTANEAKTEVALQPARPKSGSR